MTHDLARHLVRDVMAFGGLALVGTGLWWIYPPAALILLGVALLGLVIMSLVMANVHDTRKEGED